MLHNTVELEILGKSTDMSQERCFQRESDDGILAPTPSDMVELQWRLGLSSDFLSLNLESNEDTNDVRTSQL